MLELQKKATHCVYFPHLNSIDKRHERNIFKIAV